MKKRITAFLFALCLLLAFPVAACAADADFVVDEAGLLTDTEKSELTQRASAISQQYACGVYIAVLQDFTDGGYTDILACAKDYYRNNDLGVGEGRDGELLMLSMENRDFALIAYGDFGNASFTDYGKEVLEDEFLDDFADDNWYDGFPTIWTRVRKCWRCRRTAHRWMWAAIRMRRAGRWAPISPLSLSCRA